MTQAIVKNVYNTLITSKRPEQAIKIRYDYKLHLSLWETIRELIKKIIKK